ncbi:MAG: hypothetical protein ABI036_09385 [Fibrobacteria bacterium]
MPIEKCDRVRLERYFLGDSGTEEKHSVKLHLDGCPDCRGRMAAFDNERREYLLIHPFREFAAKHPGAVAGETMGAGEALRRTFSTSRWLPATAGLAACLVLLPVFMRLGLQPKVISETGIRTKGGPLLEYYLKRGGSVVPGQPSDLLRAGDELQFVYAADSHAYVTLASIDARGHVSMYRTDPSAADSLPISLPAASGAVADGGPDVGKSDAKKRTLPFAVTLDDSPGSELFVMVFGAEPLSGSAVESWLMGAYTRASGNLEGMPSLLPPPPGLPGGALPGPPGKAGASVVKTLLLRKSQA